MPSVRIIGDVHGRYKDYLAICHRAEREGLKTLQVGDLSVVSYNFLDELDPNKHKFILGNHDNIPEAKKFAHCTGDYGYIDQWSQELYTIRGAESLDKRYRAPNIDWWEDEELSYTEMCDCIEDYNSRRPLNVVSHDCPDCVRDILCGKMVLDKPIKYTKTGTFLQQLYLSFPPVTWICGHWHISFKCKTKTTNIIVLDELETYDY